MKNPLLSFASLLFFAGALPGAAAERPNVLLICIDDLRPELGCYGKDYIASPHIDHLASQGRLFSRHYVQAPTCGASRYTLLTGQYGPRGNKAIFERSRKIAEGKEVTPSLPAWFRQHGYTTVSVGKISHHPGGRGGSDWDDQTNLEMPESWDRHLMPTGPWGHPRGAMHGLANGETRQRVEKGSMAVFQSFDGPDTSYPDGLILEESLAQLEDLAAAEDPFFLAVGFIRPHLPFGSPAKYFEPYEDAQLPSIPHPEKPEGQTTWHRSGEFHGQYTSWGKDPNTDAEFATEVRKHYAACVTYVDELVGQVLAQLDESGEADNTIIVLWGDHGWHLGEHAIWGKHALFEESLHSPLIIKMPETPEPGKATPAIVETIDIYPTLTRLAKLPQPEALHGESLHPLLENPTGEGSPAVSYKGKHETIRNDRYRLIVHPDGHTELYDQESGSTENIASSHPEIVADLTAELQRKLAVPKDVE
ncbi:MAG: sulfatase [Verrucomicrobiota bacterium JB023]|nr:sulfatase [Verrucomicrobiota bacterium JB023]